MCCAVNKHVMWPLLFCWPCCEAVMAAMSKPCDAKLLLCGIYCHVVPSCGCDCPTVHSLLPDKHRLHSVCCLLQLVLV
jgi:hypothetical protein